MKKQENKIACSIEQMHVLRTMGLDTSDASMCWIKEPNEGEHRLVVHDEYCYELGCLQPVPTYTLEDILLKIRGTIDYNRFLMNNEFERSWSYFIDKNYIEGIKGWVIEYGKTPLEAAYNALISFLEKFRDNLTVLNNVKK